MLDRFGTQQVEIAFDPPPVESLLVLLLAFPVANSHDLSQGTVVLGEILELIVVVTASQPRRREDQDLPVAQTRPAACGARLAVDIAGDGPENSITHLGSAIDVLQAAEDGDGFVSAVEIQGDLGDRRTIQTPLTIKGFPHRLCSSKIWTCRSRFSHKNRGFGTNVVQSSRSIFAQSPANSSPKRILRRTLVSDDAGQFKIAGLLHGLCWLHAERSIRKLVPLSPREQEAIEGVRDAVWRYYRRLRTYRESPTPQRRVALERDFNRLFQQRTGFVDLNEALRRIHAKRDDLLLVLEHPQIPLHNNLSESDIREWAKRRKISAGTRSELGRRCRDTFVSLKKTCRKLGVSFWRYLQDRIRGLNAVLPLPDLIRQAAQQT